MITLGIIIGVLGIAMVSINYPIFAYLLRKRKEKFSSTILIALNQKEE